METIAEFIERLKSRFEADSDANASIMAVLAMEATFPRFDDAKKNETNAFQGCQSKVWLILDYNHEKDVLYVSADSDARIVRGLLAIAISLYDRRSPAEIIAHPPSLLHEVGGLDFLAPSRANGFRRVLIHVYRTACSLSRVDSGISEEGAL